MGQGGLDGETNTHFFRRFGAAILLSVLSRRPWMPPWITAAGANTAIVIGSPQQATDVAAIALQKDIDIPDTITVPQGAQVRCVGRARPGFFRGDVQDAMNEGVSSAYLAPLKPWLERDDVTDVWVNEPGAVWSRPPGRNHYAVRARRAERDGAAASGAPGCARSAPAKGLRPRASSAVGDPAGWRARSGCRVPRKFIDLALAIRKPSIVDLSVEDWHERGCSIRLRENRSARWAMTRWPPFWPRRVQAHFSRRRSRRQQDHHHLRRHRVRKDHLLNALVKEIARSERLIAIEDAAEVRLTHPNALGLLAVRGDQGEARLDADDLLAAALRMRPDRIMLGELRGREAFAFLRGGEQAATRGSITTVHADDSAGAIDQIAMLALLSGVDLGWDKLHAYMSR